MRVHDATNGSMYSDGRAAGAERYRTGRWVMDRGLWTMDRMDRVTEMETKTDNEDETADDG